MLSIRQLIDKDGPAQIHGPWETDKADLIVLVSTSLEREDSADTWKTRRFLPSEQAGRLRVGGGEGYIFSFTPE